MTIAALKELTAEYWKYRTKINEIGKELKKIEEKAHECENRLLKMMEDEGLERFDIEDCFITINVNSYVTIPHNLEQKEQMFNWLKEQGVFYDYATINYNSLQSLYKRQKEITKEGATIIPGIGHESSFSKIRAYKK